MHPYGECAGPAFFDIMGAGYTYKTPRDIEFALDAQGTIHAGVLDDRHRNVLMDVDPLP